MNQKCIHVADGDVPDVSVLDVGDPEKLPKQVTSVEAFTLIDYELNHSVLLHRNMNCNLKAPNSNKRKRCFQLEVKRYFA